MDLVLKKGYTLGNLDTTIVLQRPKISAYIPEMTRMIAEVMKTEDSKISIKAKTSENMGFIGRGEGLSAYAIVLLEKS